MRAVVILCVAALACASPLVAQSGGRSWADVLARFLPLQSPPSLDFSGAVACGAGVTLPSTVRLDGNAEDGARFYGFVAGREPGSHHRVEIRRPAGRDATDFAVVGMRCRGTDERLHSVLLKSDQRYLLYVPPLGEATYSDLRGVRADGSLVTFTWYEPARVLAPADSVAAALRAKEAAARRAAELARENYARNLEEAVAARRRERERQLRARGYRGALLRDLLAGTIRIGWTERLVLEAWGEPNDVNTTITRYGRSELWIYGRGTFVYFQNGRVATIHH